MNFATRGSTAAEELGTGKVLCCWEGRGCCFEGEADFVTPGVEEDFAFGLGEVGVFCAVCFAAGDALSDCSTDALDRLGSATESLIVITPCSGTVKPDEISKPPALCTGFGGSLRSFFLSFPSSSRALVVAKVRLVVLELEFAFCAENRDLGVKGEVCSSRRLHQHDGSHQHDGGCCANACSHTF
jgi:hypothetical protein